MQRSIRPRPSLSDTLREQSQALLREPFETLGLFLVIGIMGLALWTGLQNYQQFKLEQRAALRVLAQIQAAQMEQSKATIALSGERNPSKIADLNLKERSMAALSYCLNERLSSLPHNAISSLEYRHQLFDALPICASVLKIPASSVPFSVLSVDSDDVRLPSETSPNTSLDVLVAPSLPNRILPRDR